MPFFPFLSSFLSAISRPTGRFFNVEAHPAPLQQWHGLSKCLHDDTVYEGNVKKKVKPGN